MVIWLARAAVAYTAAALAVGAVAGTVHYRAGHTLRGAIGFGALGATFGPPLLAQAAWDRVRGRA